VIYLEYKINTVLPVHFEKIENPPYLNDSRFQAVRVYVAHEKDNYNGSWFDTSVLEKMGSRMAGVPIVGYITKNNINEEDFNGHEERLIIQDGDISIEYLGRAYGCIISNNDVEIVQRLHESGEMRNYLCVTGVLWKMFTDSIEIFDRDEVKAQSMELQEESISGKFEKDGYYHFTDATVRALCILGEGILPAMSNSVIEKFSTIDYQNQVQELLSELNESIKQFNLQNQSSDLEVDNINFFEKEDKLVDKKLELLSKHSLTIENISFNIEELSLEEIESKITEHFSLLASQKEEGIINALRMEKFMDRWGDECTKYSYVNYTDIEVFAYDRQDNWNLYGFTYSMSGDNVVIDFETKKRKKFEIVDFVDGETTVFSLFPQEAIDYAVKDNSKETEEKIANFKTISTELEELKTKISEYETTILTHETTITEFEATIETLSSENTKLQEFKSTIEFENKRIEIEGLIEDFEEVLKDNEEFEQIKKDIIIDEKLINMEYQVLEDKFFALEGKLKHDSKKKDKVKKSAAFSRVNIEIDGNKEIGSEYGEASRFLPKKN
jgi:hypothetical protein